MRDGQFANWTLVEVVEHFTASGLFRRRVNAQLLKHILDFARVHEQTFIDAAGPVSLLHGDFNSPNILVRQEHGTWRVAAILDWEFAFAGSILADIGNMVNELLDLLKNST